MNDVIVYYVDRGTGVEGRGGKVPEEGDHVNDVIVYYVDRGAGGGRCLKKVNIVSEYQIWEMTNHRITSTSIAYAVWPENSAGI